MIKRLLNKLKPKAIKDSYFGEMGSTYDKFDSCYYLDKEIELENIYTPVILCLKTPNEKSNKNQQLAYETIKMDFGTIWNLSKKYLVEDKRFITMDQLKKEYRLESITLPETINSDNMKWEIDLLNLKDGFSRIIIEMEKNKPMYYSVEA
ncbi:hypothetical protein OD91_2625 [Lutibacter sp. Hel_I_33_5]|uniref:hypothetical protein n=1 Tax=Lutibacter sp. Hel_I_33_5 TaxID=1566289 RepID=UPI0011A5065F|nr:hypothetical protein [Lutibacter sp. Hel_I_33_5]TVZ57305.1 hypothetical protein OD91_2625 [Lutibacter sp. Hel_I_33_5]